MYHVSKDKPVGTRDLTGVAAWVGVCRLDERNPLNKEQSVLDKLKLA